MNNINENIRVEKRDGRTSNFEASKISNAIKKASDQISYHLKEDDMNILLESIEKKLKDKNKEIYTVEEIQNAVEQTLVEKGFKRIKKVYSNYRKERTKIRDVKSDLMHVIDEIGIHTDRDNANVGNNFSAKLLRIASESNKWHNLALMPKKMARAHENGDIYYHDLDSYNLTINCLHVPTREALDKGFNPGYGYIRPPKRIESASELSCILLQSTQNDMFGGQSHPDFDNDMGSYLESTRNEIKKEFMELGIEVTEDIIEKKLIKTTHQAMQGICYNLNTMHSRAGSQVPFSSINIGIPKNKDAALLCQIFLEEYEKGLGKGEQPIFPNIIFRVKKGVNAEPSDPYYYLFKIACRVASKRMNPTFMNLDADFNKMYYDQGVVPATMGCRTYVCSNVNGDPGTKGRGNIAPVTINLPRLALIADCDETMFFKLLKEKLCMSRDALMHRYNVLKKLKVKDLPFIAGQGLIKGSEGLSANDSIEPILKQGTFSIGFIGLAETLTALTGKHHGESDEARKLGFKIVSCFRDFTDKQTVKTHLNWSTYATPAEGLSGRFILQDRAKFGKITGVTDKDYYTNSYHVPVGYPISIKDKIDIEAPYHKLCNAGHITYVELDDYPDEDAIMAVLEYAYNHTNISYIGINFHMRYCKECGERLYSGEENCPKCGSADIQGISRVTGYLSLDERFGAGKTAERKDRVANNTNKKIYI